jgi:predicted HTH transcriptional regulator
LIQSPQSIHKLQLFESLDILLGNEIINRKAYNLLNDLRRYRNALVHSLDIDKTVNPTIYKELEDMYELINDIYQNRNNENFHEKICKLYEYANTQGFNETEQNIIAYVSNNPTASISEISEHIGYSKASTTRKLKLLQESGLIQNQRIGKSNNWIVPNKN